MIKEGLPGPVLGRPRRTRPEGASEPGQLRRRGLCWTGPMRFTASRGQILGFFLKIFEKFENF